MLRIVNDTLELSRYEAAQIKLNLEFVDLRFIIGIVSEMIEPLTQVQGTGLGLAIVSHLVKLLEGKIPLVSEVEVGSTFTVTFPLCIQMNQ